MCLPKIGFLNPAQTCLDSDLRGKFMSHGDVKVLANLENLKNRMFVDGNSRIPDQAKLTTLRVSKSARSDNGIKTHTTVPGNKPTMAEIMQD